MKRSLCIMFLALTAISAMAAEMRIAYYDSDKIRTDWPDFVDAQGKFDKELTKWQASADSMQNAIIEQRGEYEKQQLMLSEEKRTEKEKLIQQAQSEYQAYLQQIFGQGGLAEKRNVELTKPLMEKISAVLKNISEKDGYSLVLDIAGTYSNIGYIDPTLDITDNVLKELKDMK